MGVFLYLDIVPDRISTEKWDSVYQETLTLLDNYEFLGVVKDGEYYYAARSSHQEDVDQGHAGWWVSGDMYGGRNMEDFLLYSDIAIYREWVNGCQSDDSDILLSYLDKHEGPPSCCIWGAKTQGCPAHKYLLAIACLICHRLPNAAHVYGDITAGQCRQAVNWANQFLSDPIDVPATADMTRLFPRLKAVGLTGHELLHSFYELTLEATDNNMGSYLSEQLPALVLESYYKGRFIPARERQDGVLYLNRSETKDYLAQGFCLNSLCRTIMVDPDGNKLPPREFMKALLEMKLHVPLDEKVLYNFAVSAKKRGTAEIDTVHSMLFQAFCMMHGGRNQNVAAYYPLGDICAAFEKCLGPRDYTTMAAELLEEISESTRFEIQNVIYDGQDSYYNVAIEASKKAVEYDINRLDDLPYYEPGDTIDPKLHDALLGIIKQLHEIGEENFLLYIKGAPAEKRKHFFEQNYRLLIPKTIKDAFFARIMDDAYIIRYLSLYSVDPTTDNQHKTIRALLWNPDLLDYYWNLAELEKTE